jgi:hypothetical protein
MAAAGGDPWGLDVMGRKGWEYWRMNGVSKGKKCLTR